MMTGTASLPLSLTYVRPAVASSPALSYSFNETSAVAFYSRLNTTTGLLAEQPGSHTIWLSDDQALDYHALSSIYSSTHNSTALDLARQINGSIAQWGGFFKYWNPVFEAIGSYPNSTEVVCGNDTTIGTAQGYTVNATVFAPCSPFRYSYFADLVAYRVLLDLHFQNYTGAQAEFTALSNMWDGHGFADQTFREDMNSTYQSYKLATYLIVWKTLDQTTCTQRFAQGYVSTADRVATTMSRLQSDGPPGVAGGVWTGYRFHSGQLVYGSNVTGANGETTSLFVLASQPEVSVSCPSTMSWSQYLVGAGVVVSILVVAGATIVLLRRRRSREHRGEPSGVRSQSSHLQRNPAEAQRIRAMR